VYNNIIMIKAKSLMTILVAISVINTFIVLILVLFQKNSTFIPVKNNDEIITQIGDEDIDRSSDPTDLRIRGTIKKEIIPPELDLGDGYWYWFYFDEPFLNKESANGLPMLTEKLQVFPPKDVENYDIENFLNKRVEAFGNMTWGYAESNVIQLIAIRTL
jgi:hypothetical protein